MPLATKDRTIVLARRALLLGAAAFGASLRCLPARAADAVGKVVSSLGSAFLDRADGKVTANDGVPVLLHDLAETSEASRLELLIGEVTRVKLGAKAKFQIDRFVPAIAAKLRIEGAFLVEHGPGAEPDLEVETPYALIAARGTKFWGGPSNGVFGVFVVDGEVEVRAAGKSVVVAPGMGTDIKVSQADSKGARASGSPPEPPHVWNQERVQAALRTVL
jgi:hypothetical protein